jgi:hypothetical protein
VVDQIDTDRLTHLRCVCRVCAGMTDASEARSQLDVVREPGGAYYLYWNERIEYSNLETDWIETNVNSAFA